MISFKYREYCVEISIGKSSTNIEIAPCMHLSDNTWDCITWRRHDFNRIKNKIDNMIDKRENTKIDFEKRKKLEKDFVEWINKPS